MRTTILLSMLLLGGGLSAQMVQKCCNTGNSTFLLGNLSSASHSQCIYTPGDLVGEQAGDIYRLYYRYGTTGIATGNTLSNFMVRLVQTPASSFTSNLFFTGLDTVLMVPTFTIPPGNTGDWFVIDLDSTFTYDETLTLIVDISFTGSTTTNFGTASQSMAGRKLYWSDTTSPTGQSLVSSWQDVGFDLILPTGMREQEPPFLSLTPNPAGNNVQLFFNSSLTRSCIVEMYDMSGKQVLSNELPLGTTTMSIELSALSEGLYNLRVSGKDGLIHNLRLLHQW